MLTKHYLQRAFMNHRQDESFLTDLVAIPLQFTYATCWDFWHTSSIVSSLDTGKIDLQNWFYYKKHKMTAKDCRKASKITLKIYEAMIKSSLFTNVSRDKQYYSYIYDRYYENIDLPRVLVCVHADKNLKNQQELRIKFDANQAKAIEADQYLTILNQCLANIDDDLTVLTPTNKNGWYIYKIKDNSVNYRINLANYKNRNHQYTIYLDGGHSWNLAKEQGALISGSSGTGKTALIESLIYMLLYYTNNVSVYVADGKHDELFAVMSQILPQSHVVAGTDASLLVHKLVKIADKRYQDMSKKRKKNPRLAFADFDKFGFKMIVIIIDEQSAITASLTESKSRKQYENDLMKLVQIGRAAGIVPILAMQQANASSLGGTLGTAIREQLVGLRVLMGSPATITSQDRQMMFGTGVELPPTRFDQVGSGYLQTASMSNPEPFQAPLLPSKSEDLYKLLKHNS
ncbi:AAA family ATPase [Lactobacillus gallinarum]|uniref:AAA family ATPase n=1 Tax=Lactobacillus gallinarum TaxID=52242 RepID=UPI0025A3C1C1|nr:AAA family ATPase [Lactobacillus gallinarum]MDM8282518.1 AAA family ATPase [Lactobacillus gallinarum]